MAAILLSHSPAPSRHGTRQGGFRSSSQTRGYSLLLAVLSLLIVPASRSDDMPTSISNTELLRMIESGAPPAILDTRSGWEFDQGHLPGAVHMPFWKAFALADELGLPTDQPVVIYCEHGPRAGFAKAALKYHGFERILYLKGHMSGWKKAGLPLAASPQDH